MVGGDDLHRLLNELVALIFEFLSVAELARVDTTAEVVILRWRRRRSAEDRLGWYRICETHTIEGCLPITVRRDDIVDPQLLTDLLNPQMRDISVQLLRRHRRSDGSR